MAEDQNRRAEISFGNFSKAVVQLNQFLALPIQDERDRAGVIQAFEFCYELAWITLKKLAETQGLMVSTPIDAFRAGFQMGLIQEKEHSVWLDAKRARNLTSHTYREELAAEVLKKIQSIYAPAFNDLNTRLKAFFPSPT